MKFCQRCGEEIMDGEVFCPGCGCTVAKEIEKTEISYAKCVKVAATTAILSAVAILLGIICWLLINMWVGVYYAWQPSLLRFHPIQICKGHLSETD